MFCEPHSPRVVGGLVLAYAVMLVLPSRALDESVDSDRRMTERLDVRATPAAISNQDESAGKSRTQGLDLGLIISGAYNDNIARSSTAPVKDYEIRTTPSVAYERGSAESSEGGYLKLAYRPSSVIYAEGGSPDRLEHDASWDIGLRGQRVAIAYGGRYQKLGGPSTDVGQLTDRSVLEQVVRAAWSPTGKVAIELAAGQSKTDYEPRNLVDSSGAYGEVAVRYYHSPKTTLGVAYRAGEFKVDGASPQEVQRLTGRLEWKPREKVRVDIEAGAEHRKFDAGSTTRPVVNARLGWTPREGSEIALTGYQRTEASSFFAGQNYDVSGVSVSASQRIGKQWQAVLEGGVERTRYNRVSGTGTADRRDRVVFIKPALRYQINEDCTIEGFYRYERNQSNQAAFGYDNHIIGLEFGYHF